MTSLPGGEAGEQVRHRMRVGGLAGGEGEAHRQAAGIDAGVELGAQSAVGTTDGVIRPSFLPPAACWCARTMELSISASEPGDRAANASKIESHTPRLTRR